MSDAEENTSPSAAELRHTPLHAWHQAASAKTADFGGWEMPIDYPDAGVVAEHTAVREAVGIFDVSHLGTFTLKGPGAAELLNTCISNDLNKIGPGRAQYNLWCTPDGGVLDDIIVYLRSDDDVLVIPNAANAAAVMQQLQAAIDAAGQSGSIVITDMHDQVAIMAVQGPSCGAVMEACGLPQPQQYMSFEDVPMDGFQVTVCRTGYTGERGFEVLCDSANAMALWEKLVAAVRAEGGQVCGLGARDTLRTEMGYPLHGNDLSPEISAVSAGASWAIGWKKPEFIGKEALEADKANPKQKIWGLKATGRGVPRAHLAVYRGDEQIGETTSGTFSPTLKTGIALALLSLDVAAGDEVEIDVRGRRLPCVVQRPPFVETNVRD